MSNIEKELFSAVKIKPQVPGEDRQKYLTRLVKAVCKISDDDWDELAGESKEWTNEAAANIKAGGKIADFPDLEPEEDPLEELLAVSPEPPEEKIDEDGVVTEKSPELEPAAAATKQGKKAKRVKRASNGRTLSACHHIKKVVVTHPSISVAELSDSLKKAGFKVTALTIQSMRSNVRDVLRTLNELNLGEFDL